MKAWVSTMGKVEVNMGRARRQDRYTQSREQEVMGLALSILDGWEFVFLMQPIFSVIGTK